MSEYKSKLAVVITAGYVNRMPYLVDVLYCLNNQSMQGFNVVLVDDSDDMAPDSLFRQLVGFMATYKTMPTIAYDPRLPLDYAKKKDKFAFVHRLASEGIKFGMSYLKTSGKTGCSASCIAGIKYAIDNFKPEYIALHDDDDMSVYNRFELQVQALDEAKKNGIKVSACGCDKLEFGMMHAGRSAKAAIPQITKEMIDGCKVGENADKSDQEICDAIMHHHINRTIINIQAQALFFGAAMYKPCTMMTAEAAVNAFDPSFVSIGDDIVMNSRLAQAGQIIYIPQPLVLYRRHGSNLSSTENNKFREGYTRAVKQNIKDLLGIEVSQDFLNDFYATWHKLEMSDRIDEIAENTKAVLKQYAPIPVECIDWLLDTTVNQIREAHAKGEIK
jgi:glycosyltransferase involved in cell wall biosynthesis